MPPTAFFAYPNDSRISDTIGSFVEKINATGLATFETWEQMNIGGKLLVSEICKRINHCDVFCADITRLNPNVLFEVGYAIARKKRIWLIRDTSIPAENNDFKQFKILTTLGYREYLNAGDILTAYYSDRPHESLEETVYDEVIEPAISIAGDQHLLYLKCAYEDEASVKISQALSVATERKTLPLLVDDPRENGIQPLGWYAKNVYTSQAVVCHLTGAERDNSKIQNAKHSLIAGLAHGFDIPLLLLIEANLFGPTDYRELLFSYSRSKDAVSHLNGFISPIIAATKNLDSSRRAGRARNKNIQELAMLQIGEPIAEHEDEALSENAFVPTAAYRAALDGSQAIFVGRKGMGKTANFKKLSSYFTNDKRNLVCEIKPLSYELETLVEVAKRFEQISKKGFLFESLWKFLIYSELAKILVESIEVRASGEIGSQERKLVDLVAKNSALLKLDFSARLDALSKTLLTADIVDSPTPDTNLAVSEKLHSGLIPELLSGLAQALVNKKQVVILIDNLDKAWDKSENTRFLSYFFLGLLSALRRISNDFKNRPLPVEQKKVSLCVFVRADIFEMVLEQAREPDKITYQLLSWDDRDQLRNLADARIKAAAGIQDEDISADQIWNKFFRTSGDERVFDYLFRVILPRPRDLLYFLRSSILTAVNRRHEKVEEQDFQKGEDDYSNFAFQSMLVELRQRYPNIEEIIQEFMGADPIMNIDDARSKIAEINAVEVERVLTSLMLTSFFELEVPSKGFVLVKDEKEYVRLFKACSNLSARTGGTIRLRIHRAFWATLLIDSAAPH